MDMQIPFFVCGPHCSGKTSILKNLYQEGIIRDRGSEIGKDLFYQRNLDTASQDAKFEIEITQMEIARDEKYLEKNGMVGIESWHPGNLAYAMVRNPSAVSELIKIMRKSKLLSSAYGIRLYASWESIFLRTQTFYQNRKWAADFYTQIGNCLEVAIEKLGLTERCFIIDANRPYSDVYSDVKRVIKEVLDKERSGINR